MIMPSGHHMGDVWRVLCWARPSNGVVKSLTTRSPNTRIDAPGVDENIGQRGLQIVINVREIGTNKTDKIMTSQRNELRYLRNGRRIQSVQSSVEQGVVASANRLRNL